MNAYRCPTCAEESDWVTVCRDVLQLVCPNGHEWSLPLTGGYQ